MLNRIVYLYKNAIKPNQTHTYNLDIYEGYSINKVTFVFAVSNRKHCL